MCIRDRCDNVKDVGLYIEKIDEMIERKRELFAEDIECYEKGDSFGGKANQEAME